MFVLRSKGLKAAFALCLAVTMLFAWVVPAQALLPPGPIVIIPPIFQLPIWKYLIQGIDGNITDVGTNAPLGGIVVSSYETSTGAYISSAVTDSSGHYDLFLKNGVYNLQFRDPSGIYGQVWYVSAVNQAMTVPVLVNNGWTPRNVQLKQAGSITMIARRAGHPLTLLPGIFAIAQQNDGFNHVSQWSNSTNGAGVVAFSGLPIGNGTWPKYMESGIDPTGRFGPADADDWHTIVGGSNVSYCDMYVAGSSHEITPTVPASSKYTRSANVKFTVTGKFSKSLAGGKQIKILAVKGGTRKVFTGTISSGKYSAKVKLSKGTWTLYALFTGNSTFAPNDSLLGKVFKVK